MALADATLPTVKQPVPVADEMPAHGDDVELAAPPPRKREKFSDAEEDGAPENNDPVEMNGAETSTAS